MFDDNKGKPTSTPPQKSRRQTPYERIKDQLDAKTRECEQLQEANSGLDMSLSNVRQNLETERATIQFMEKSRQRALSRHIHVDNYVNALLERIADLKKPWWARSASHSNQLRVASDMALDRINRFDMDKDPSAADAPGAIMGLEPRTQQSGYLGTPQQQPSANQRDPGPKADPRHRPF